MPGEEDRRARQHRHQDGEKGGGPVLALILPGHGDGALQELRHVPVREGLGGLLPAGAQQLRHREAQGGGQGLQGVDIREAHAPLPATHRFIRDADASRQLRLSHIPCPAGLRQESSEYCRVHGHDLLCLSGSSIAPGRRKVNRRRLERGVSGFDDSFP